MPPIEWRCEWRKQQTLIRQNAVPNNTPNEFKAGVPGGRKLMTAFLTHDNYLWCDKQGSRTRRTNEMNQVRVGDTLHMKTKGLKHDLHYEGVVMSEFSNISATELVADYPEIWQDTETDHPFKICDVKWVKKPLTEEMKVYLTQRVIDGGGCTKQCGTLIPLA